MKTNWCAANSTFAIDGVSCFADSFVVTENFYLRMNVCAGMPPIANLQNVVHNAFELLLTISK